MDHAKKLDELFRLDALARQAEQDLMDTEDTAGLSRILSQAVLSNVDDPNAEDRLLLAIGLLAQVETAEAAQTLFGLLDDSRDVGDRVIGAVAEALVDLGEASFDLLEQAAKEVLDRGASPMVLEALSYLLGEVEQPAKVGFMLTMLKHTDPQVVVAALEAAGEQGWDDRVWKQLLSLSADTRKVTIEDEQEGHVEMSVAELASEVIEALRALGRDDG
jgi:hypothetical protein